MTTRSVQTTKSITHSRNISPIIRALSRCSILYTSSITKALQKWRIPQTLKNSYDLIIDPLNRTMRALRRLRLTNELLSNARPASKSIDLNAHAWRKGTASSEHNGDETEAFSSDNSVYDNLLPSRVKSIHWAMFILSSSATATSKLEDHKWHRRSSNQSRWR